MRKLTAIVGTIGLVLIVIGQTLSIARAQQPIDPEAVVRAMIGAFGAGDIEQFASYLSEDATATGFCRPAGVCRSKAEIVAATAEEIAEKVHPEIRSLSVDGNTVTVALTESTEAFAPLGIERVYIDLVLTVVDGKVTYFDDQFDTSDPQTASLAKALKGETAEQPGAPPATGDGSAADGAHPVVPTATTLLAAGITALALGAAWRWRHRAPRKEDA